MVPVDLKKINSPPVLTSTSLDHVVEFKLLKNQEILFVA